MPSPSENRQFDEYSTNQNWRLAYRLVKREWEYDYIIFSTFFHMENIVPLVAFITKLMQYYLLKIWKMLILFIFFLFFFLQINFSPFKHFPILLLSSIPILNNFLLSYAHYWEVLCPLNKRGWRKLCKPITVTTEPVKKNQLFNSLQMLLS